MRVKMVPGAAKQQPKAQPKEQGDVAVVTEPRQKVKLSRPPLYRVLLHNDDFTPMEFVVSLLESVFQRSESEALAIMLHAHTTGMAVAGVYTFEIAEAKVEKVTALSEEADFPLLCTLEPESDGDGTESNG
jgi:ATP-dependent Clp protease adaptor protein ClpS